MSKYDKVTAGMASGMAPTTSAGWINSVSEVAEWYEKNIRLGRSSSPAGGAEPLVQVQNTTGADLARGSVVELGAGLLDEIDREFLWYEGNEYSDGVLAILVDPIEDDLIGPARTLGAAVALVNVTSTSHRFAAPAAGETVLQSATEGPVQILGTLSTTGEQECAVLIGVSGGGGGSTLLRGMLYDNLPGQSANDDGEITSGGTGRVLPMKEGVAPSSLTADLDAEFIDAELWDLATFGVGGEGCCDGGADTIPTGPRITYPIGEGGLNRFATLDTAAGSAAFAGRGAVPGELLTLTLQAINPTTGALTGSVITWTNDGDTTLTNNGDGSWSTTPQSLAGISRGLCRVAIDNGSTGHAALVLWSADEWDPTSNSNGVGQVYFDGKPNPPDLQAASDTGGSSVDNVTDDDTPSFSIAFGGATFTPSSNTHGLLYAINQSTGAVTVVTGAATDFDSGLTITKTVGSALADGVYEVQCVIYFDLTGGGYTYNTWYSPPSNPLRIQIVDDAAAVPAKRYAHLCMYTTIGGVVYASPGRCRRPITDDEATKLDA